MPQFTESQLHWHPAVSRAASSPNLNARKHDFVRGAIWDAAIDLFVEKGFDQTTVEEIAEHAGVSRRSFFRYFSSKADLMGQGIVTYANVLTEAVQSCPRSAAPLEVVRHSVLRLVELAAAQPRTRKIMLVAYGSPAAREAQLSRMADAEELIVRAFAARITGRETVITPRLLAALTTSILDVTFRAWFERNDTDITATAEQVFETLTKVVNGKKPPSPISAARKTRRS
jgi:AcrR family transcriptional regulator